MRAIFALLLSSVWLGSVAGAAEPSLNELWKNPAFLKSFHQGFGFNGAVEPAIGEAERKVREQVEVLMKERKVAEAARVILKGITPDTPGLNFLLGNLLFQYGQLPQAEAQFMEALRKFPNYREAFKNLAFAQSRLGKHEACVKNLSRAIALGSSDSATWGVFATALMASKQAAAAETAFRNALMFEPDQINWKLGILGSLVEQKKYSEAVAMFDELIRAFPNKGEYLAKQAVLLIELNQNMRAAENFEILARSGQAKAADLNLLGKLYLKENRVKLAESAFSRALLVDPDIPVEEMLANAEYLFNAAGLAEAKSYAQRARAAAGDRFEARHLERYLKLEAKIAAAQGATDEQIKLLEEVVSMNPTDGYSILSLAKHYMADAANLDKAAAKLEMAAKINQDFEADALLLLAQIDIKKNKHSDALPKLLRSYEIKKRDSVQGLIEQVKRYLKKNTK